MSSPDALARGQSAGYALAASSNSLTASRLFSATSACALSVALRVSRITCARACANSSASPSHHSASEAIASSARSGCPWTSAARYSANDATTRACRRASSGCRASAQSKPVGTWVAILRPLCSRTLRAFPKPRNRKPLLPNRSKGDYVDEGVESSTSKALDAGGERAGRVRCLPPPIPPRWESGVLGRRGPPRELSTVSTRGQADAQRGQSVGSTVSSECRCSTGLPGGETRSSVRASDSARISFACAEGLPLPRFRSSGKRASARLCTRFGSGSSRMPIGLPECGRCDPARGRERPRVRFFFCVSSSTHLRSEFPSEPKDFPCPGQKGSGMPRKPDVYNAKWRKVRKLVLERDRYVCKLRYPKCTLVAGHVDHI